MNWHTVLWKWAYCGFCTACQSIEEWRVKLYLGTMTGDSYVCCLCCSLTEEVMQNVQSCQEEQQNDVTGQSIRRIRQLQTWRGQQRNVHTVLVQNLLMFGSHSFWWWRRGWPGSRKQSRLTSRGAEAGRWRKRAGRRVKAFIVTPSATDKMPFHKGFHYKTLGCSTWQGYNASRSSWRRTDRQKTLSTSLIFVTSWTEHGGTNLILAESDY